MRRTFPATVNLGVIALVVAALATGCSSNRSRSAPPTDRAGSAPTDSSGSTPNRPKPVLKPTQSGFLRDYSRLVPSPRHPGTMYQQSKTLSSYTGFLVEPVQVLATKTARAVPLDAPQAAALADALRNELTEALSLRGRLATAPGPRVARIRAAITSVAKSDRSSPDRPMIGGASVEADIVDSVTGARVAAVMESDLVEDSELGRSSDPFYDARLVFRHWASRLNLWFESADELATE